MRDVLDKILDLLPPSTFELVLKYDRDGAENSFKLNTLLEETQQIQKDLACKELQRKYLDLKSKAVDNSNIIAKLLKELEISKNVMSKTNQQNIDSLKRRSREYDIQINQINKNFNNVNCLELFKDIEQLNESIEVLKKNFNETEKKNECFDGFPSNLEEAKKVVEDIKERIKAQEKGLNL